MTGIVRSIAGFLKASYPVVFPRVLTSWQSNNQLTTRMGNDVISAQMWRAEVNPEAPTPNNPSRKALLISNMAGAEVAERNQIVTDTFCATIRTTGRSGELMAVAHNLEQARFYEKYLGMRVISYNNGLLLMVSWPEAREF